MESFFGYFKSMYLCIQHGTIFKPIVSYRCKSAIFRIFYEPHTVYVLRASLKLCIFSQYFLEHMKKVQRLAFKGTCWDHMLCQ